MVARAGVPEVLAKIQTGAKPCGSATGFGSVWVAGYGTGRLVRIDPARNRVMRRIRVARAICRVAIGAGSVWVANDRTNTVYRVNPRTGRIAARIRVGAWPADLELAFGSLWVTAFERGTVARIDLRTNRISRIYEVGGKPAGLAEVGRSLWVAAGRGGRTLGELDPATGTVRSAELGRTGPGFLEFALGSLWTTTADGYAIRFDPVGRRVVAAFRIPGTPAQLAAGPDGSVWIAEKERNTITRVDPAANRIIDVFGAGRGAFALAIAGGDVWVTSFAGNDVWRFRARA
jgi:streptogramin lyase